MDSKYYLLLCTLLLCASTFTILSNSPKKENYQHTPSHADREQLMLYRPIKSKEDMRTFFGDTFDRPDYVTDILPFDLSHFVQCLKYTQEHYRTRMHGKHVLRLFMSKIRDCKFIAPEAFSTMLEEITPILARYLHDSEQTVAKAWQKNFDALLSNAFLSHFSDFKEKPYAFLHALSETITSTMFEQEQDVLQDINVQEFRETVFRFIDLGLNKLVWNLDDGIQTWKQVKRIANQLAHYCEQRIFNNGDDLQDLRDGLVKRYCNIYLEIGGAALPLDFYQEVKRELAAQTFELVDSEELERCIETKRQRLIRGLLEAETAARLEQRTFATA